jgi:hypothetical protein
MRPIESLLPMTQLRVPVPHLFPAQRHRFFIGRVLDGGPPTETEDESASRRSASLRRIARASWGHCLPPTRGRDRTSDTSVATPARYRCALLFAVRVDSPIRREPPRPLPPRRRENGEAFPGPRRLPSTGDVLLFFRPFDRRLHTLRPQVSPTDRSVGFSRGPPVRWLQPTRVRGLDSLSPAAPHGTSGRRIVRLRTRRAPLADATFTHDCTSAGLAPVHLVPPPPFRAVTLRGKGFCGSEPPIDFCKRDNDVRAHPRASPPRPPSITCPLRSR